jgi:hypothetical protein
LNRSKARFILPCVLSKEDLCVLIKAFAHPEVIPYRGESARRLPNFSSLQVLKVRKLCVLVLLCPAWIKFPALCNFVLVVSFLGRGETVHLVRQPIIGPLYQPRMMDDDERGAVS